MHRHPLADNGALAALTALMRSPVLQDSDVVTSMRAITEAGTNLMGAARVGIWLFTTDRQAIATMDQYDARTGSHTSNTVLRAEDHPTYFRELLHSDLIAADDAISDPRTFEFRDRYFVPHDIAATLDVPIIVGGEMKGIVCFEFAGQPHHWTHDEQSFALAVANLVSLVLAQAERLRSEARLRQGRRQTRMILDSVQEGIIGIDADGRILHANPAATRTLAYAESELLGRSVDVLFPKQATADNGRADCAIRATLHDGSWRRVTDESFVRRTGESFPVEYTCAAIRGDTQPTPGVVLSFRDITSRRRNERQRAVEARAMELISTGASLDTILNAIASGLEEIVPDVIASILLLDPDGQHLRFGAGPSLPDEYNRLIDGMPIGPESGSCGTAMYRGELVVCADIETDPLFADFRHLVLPFGLRACASMPVRDSQGNVVACTAIYRKEPGIPADFELALFERIDHLVGIAIERHQRELALRASEERFRYVAQGVLDAVWDWNLESETVWWNHGIQALFGHRLEALEPGPESWTRRIHPDDQARVVAGIHAAIDGTGSDWEDRYRFRRSDGSHAHVMDRGMIIRNESGKAVRMVGGMTDITERLALEEQLQQSQRLESIGQLTGGVAHDFNNLLTVILGNAELLADELAQNPELASIADTVVETAQRGADLTHRLLAFARRQSLEPRTTNINDLVGGMSGLLKRTLGAQIQIDLVRADPLWPALVDPAQLESALLNLCLNARDAMPEGGHMTIRTSNAVVTGDVPEISSGLTPGEYVLIAVTDTGVGIAPQDLERVFEPFYTTKSKGKGTGLGLSMVYGFVTQSRGHVRIDSKPGRGTTVTMYLPRCTTEGRARVCDPKTIDPRNAPTSGGLEHIMLVEDDDLVRRFAYDQLVALGYQVTAAAGGDEALHILSASESIDLLLTDVIMPGMDGRQLARRAVQIQPDLRVLFTSGYTDNPILPMDGSDGSAQLLHKPYRREELARYVRAALGDRHTEN